MFFAQSATSCQSDEKEKENPIEDSWDALQINLRGQFSLGHKQ
jgi:hypothetical protein